MKRLYWDYYGGDAQGIAGHFAVHLGDYLVRNGLGHVARGVESDRPGHGAAWADVPDEAVDTVIKALRPKRMAESGEGSGEGVTAED